MVDSVKGFITNEWDRDNLKFLLNSNDECLQDWYKQADADDLMYAQELLNAYAKELQYRAKELLIENSLQASSEFSDAMIVINKCK